jgi:hypothetical protein
MMEYLINLPNLAALAGVVAWRYGTYKKVGGLHFVRLGRLGFSFYISAKKSAVKPQSVLQ